MASDALPGDEIVRLAKEHVLTSWSAQGSLNQIPMVRAEGVFMWDAAGKRYFDLSAQLMCNNLGHGNKHVIEGMKKQLDKFQFFHPAFAHEPKSRLAKMITEVAPGNMKKVFFTNGGADAIENAMKMARMVTGRQKVMSRYGSYHGATYGASALSGDPRRWGAEPGMIGAVHFYAPYFYRCPFGSTTPEECTERNLAHLEQTILYENADQVAAIFLEGVSGSSGIFLYTPGYMEGVRRLCDKYGILLVIDEVMSGFGRTGKWFGCQNYDARPDMITMAKGLTAAYAPLGAVAVSERIAKHFDDKVLVAGLTYQGHPVSCAAGVAAIEAYKKEKVVENAAAMGKVQTALLEELMAKHHSVGEFRNLGLFGVLEIVKDRKTREPMAPWNAKATEMAVMNNVNGFLRQKGIITFVRWNWIFVVPPLVITEAELREAFAILDEALAITDEAYTGDRPKTVVKPAPKHGTKAPAGKAGKGNGNRADA